MQISKSRWFLPGFSVGLGIVMMAAIWLGGDLSLGLQALGVMTILAAIIFFGGRSETIRGLRGDGRDERFRQIDLAATAIAGLAVITAIIVGFLVEVGAGPGRQAVLVARRGGRPRLPRRHRRPAHARLAARKRARPVLLSP